MYHLIPSSTNLYWPSTSQYCHILTQYHQVPLIIHHLVRHSSANWIISHFTTNLMSHAQYTWSSYKNIWSSLLYVWSIWSFKMNYLARKWWESCSLPRKNLSLRKTILCTRLRWFWYLLHVCIVNLFKQQNSTRLISKTSPWSQDHHNFQNRCCRHWDYCLSHRR